MMVTHSASFTLKVAQALPVKAKESLGSAAKKVLKKKPDDQPPAMPVREVVDMATEAINDDDSLPLLQHSPPSLASATSKTLTKPPTPASGCNPPPSTDTSSTATPSTPKHAKTTMTDSLATPTHHNLSRLPALTTFTSLSRLLLKVWP